MLVIGKLKLRKLKRAPRNSRPDLKILPGNKYEIYYYCAE